MKQFGDERVCINYDDILPIKSITIDPHFFAQFESVDDLKEYQSDNDGLCYGLLNLDPRDGKAYCVSQGKAVMINNHYVQAGDIRDALNFVVPTEMGNDDAICSSCLYKYLVTLTDVLQGLLSDSERGKVILTYAKDLVNRIANDLSQGVISFHRNSIDSEHEEFDTIIQKLSEKHYEIVTSLREPKDDALRHLLDAYRKLYKLESVFLHQVVSLNQEEEEVSALTYLRLMVSTTRKILLLHDELRELNLTVLSQGEISSEQEEMLTRTNTTRQDAERDLRKLMPLLSEI